MSDPIEPRPTRPLIDSYSYHSPLPDWLLQDRLDQDEKGIKDENEEGWILGIDEAGRGPVLGPMVYAAAYCPLSFKPTLESLGFDDSKALSHETRDALWGAFTAHPSLVYSSTTLSPQDISSGMLRRSPFNLNRQAEEATIGLIREALARGVNLKEVYVDALGPAAQWQSRLSQIFPTLSIVVEAKADSTYKIVGAASIVAKVTRDRWIEMWIHPEGKGVERDELMVPVQAPSRVGREGEDVGEGSSKGKAVRGKGKEKGKERSGKGRKGKGKGKQVEEEAAQDEQEAARTDVDEASDLSDDDRPRKRARRTLAGRGDETMASGLLESSLLAEVDEPVGKVEVVELGDVNMDVVDQDDGPTMKEALGSGYPSDPKTQNYLKSTFSPIFGYPSLVRFSWAGPKLRLEKDGVGCKWVDEGEVGGGQKRLDFSKGNVGKGAGVGGDKEKGRAKLWKDLGLREVAEL